VSIAFSRDIFFGGGFDTGFGLELTSTTSGVDFDFGFGFGLALISTTNGVGLGFATDVGPERVALSAPRSAEGDLGRFWGVDSAVFTCA